MIPGADLVAKASLAVLAKKAKVPMGGTLEFNRDGREGPEISGEGETKTTKSVKEEGPYAHVICKKYRKSLCANCFRMESGMKRCSKCDFNYYCDASCIKSDWKNHKHECEILEASKGKDLPDICRLLLRVIGKHKKNPDISAFNGRTFWSLRWEFHEPDSFARKNYAFEKIWKIFSEFPEKQPMRHELFEYYCKVTMNALPITGYEGIELGLGLYLGISELDHSCLPDAFCLFAGTTLVLRSTTEGEYHSELTIPYCNLLERTSLKQRFFKNNYCFECKCPLCCDPTRDTIASAIKCTNSHVKNSCSNIGYFPVNEKEILPCTVCGFKPEGKCRWLFLLQIANTEKFVEKFDENTSEGIDAAITFYNSISQLHDTCIPKSKLAAKIIQYCVEKKDYPPQLTTIIEASIMSIIQYLPAGYPFASERYFTLAKVYAQDSRRRPAMQEILKSAIVMLQASHGYDHHYVIEAVGLYKQLLTRSLPSRRVRDLRDLLN